MGKTRTGAVGCGEEVLRFLLLLASPEWSLSHLPLFFLFHLSYCFSTNLTARAGHFDDTPKLFGILPNSIHFIAMTAVGIGYGMEHLDRIITAKSPL